MSSISTLISEIKFLLDEAREVPELVGRDPYRGGITNLGEFNRNAPENISKLISLVEILNAELIRAKHGFGLLRMLSDRHDTAGGCNVNMPNIYKNALSSEIQIADVLSKIEKILGEK